MLRTFAVGRLGKDATHRQTQNGTDICSFSLAADVGFGDNKQTVWLDVSKFGKGAEGLSRILRKGSQVAVVGEQSTREYEGRTYMQLKADDVSIMSTPDGGNRQGGGATPPPSNGGYDELDDEVPFITAHGNF